jgi:hypothetical protein
MAYGLIRFSSHAREFGLKIWPRSLSDEPKKTRLCCSRVAEQKGALETNETKLVFV